MIVLAVWACYRSLLAGDTGTTMPILNTLCTTGFQLSTGTRMANLLARSSSRTIGAVAISAGGPFTAGHVAPRTMSITDLGLDGLGGIRRVTRSMTRSHGLTLTKDVFDLLPANTRRQKRAVPPPHRADIIGMFITSCN